jgi:hypothetical protein
LNPIGAAPVNYQGSSAICILYIFQIEVGPVIIPCTEIFVHCKAIQPDSIAGLEAQVGPHFGETISDQHLVHRAARRELVGQGSASDSIITPGNRAAGAAG